ncbi:MAG: hypothetical protein NUV91_01030 [Candidatus Omnitrophica bacterium]|nr:hypothetical protein [Candidatus Omnitrophota bacterium]
MVKKFPLLANEAVHQRPLIKWAITAEMANLTIALHEEEEKERIQDRAYWALLRKELEILCHQAARRE